MSDEPAAAPPVPAAAPPADAHEGSTEGGGGSTAQTLARAGLIVTVAFAISRILGYVRILAVTYAMGDQLSDLDAFFAAFRIPDLIFQLVAAGALSAALVPMVARYLGLGEADRAWRVVSSITNLMLIGLGILAALVYATADVVVPLITPGFDPDQVELTVQLTRIMLLSPILLAIGAVATSVLNAQGRFAAAAVAPIAYNLGIIFGAVALAPAMGAYGLAIGVVLGAAAHVLVQLVPLARTGFRYRPRVDARDPEVPRTLWLMAPRAIGLGAAQITFVAITFFASSLPEGSLTVFYIAQSLLQIPLGVIGVPLGIVLLPTLSREIATGAFATFALLVSQAIRVLLVVMLPIAAVGIVLRDDLVALLFGGAQLDPAAVTATADTLGWFLVGLAAHSMIAVLARAFYAGRDTWTPVFAAITSVGVNIVVAAATVGTLGLMGLALSIAVGAWIEVTILAVLLLRRYPQIEIRPIAITMARALVASAIAAGAALLTLAGLRSLGGSATSPSSLAVELAAGSLAGAIAYAGMLILLRAPELPALVGLGRDLIRPRRTAPR